MWYGIAFSRRNSKYFASFLHLLLVESITYTHDMSSSTMTYDHHLHVDTSTIASIYSTKRKLHEVWHAGRIDDNHMAPAIMPYHDIQVTKHNITKYNHIIQLLSWRRLYHITCSCKNKLDVLLLVLCIFYVATRVCMAKRFASYVTT